MNHQRRKSGPLALAQLRLAVHAGGAHAARDGLSNGLRGRSCKRVGWRPRNESDACSLRSQRSSIDFAIEDAVAVQVPMATGTERTNPGAVSRGIFMAATATVGTRLRVVTQDARVTPSSPGTPANEGRLTTYGRPLPRTTATHREAVRNTEPGRPVPKGAMLIPPALLPDREMGPKILRDPVAPNSCRQN